MEFDSPPLAPKLGVINERDYNGETLLTFCAVNNNISLTNKSNIDKKIIANNDKNNKK